MNRFRVFFSDGLALHHPAVFRALEEILVELGLEYRLIPDTLDIWCQDFMPVHSPGNQMVKFRHRVGHRQINGQEAPEIPEDWVLTLPFIHKCLYVALTMDGGCLELNHKTLLVSQAVQEWNPKVAPEELTRRLQENLEVERVVWLPTHPDDPLAHLQREVRLLTPQLAVLTEPHGPWAQHTLRLESLLAQNGIATQRLPHPHPERAEWPRHDYLSFLNIGGNILLPVYGCAEDQQAQDTLTRLAPDHRIQPVHSLALDKLGGYLNRMAWVNEMPVDIDDWYY